jgi:hypothetical protein
MPLGNQPECTVKEQPDLAAPVEAQARRLLAEAGSAELAKHAVDVAVHAEPATGSPGDRFAAEWGFDSYLSLFEASLPLASVGGKNWCVTAIGSGKWILWNDADLVATQHASREEAEHHVSQAGNYDPASATQTAP